MKIVKIFLASSSELKEEREQLEIFINRKNKLFIKDRVFLHLEIWEDFLDVMSKTRLQDEYNKSIQKSDIFIMLYFDKVGKYSNEEFFTAYNTFKQHDKPLILTYCKISSIQINQINKNQINSLLKFKNELKNLGHFPTEYTNIEGLKNHFNEQILKLENNGYFDLTDEENKIYKSGLEEKDIKICSEIIKRKLTYNEETLLFNIETERYVSLISTTNDKEYILYNLSTGSSTALGYENFEIKLIKDKTKRENGFIEVERRHNSSFKQSYRVKFIPSLKKEERAEFCIYSKSDSKRFIAFEDFELARIDGKFTNDRLDEMYTKKITTPTDKHISILEFPKNFPIDSDFKYSVKKGLKNYLDFDSNHIKFEIFKNDEENIIVKLEVEKPIIGLNYALRWTPPRIEKLNNCQSMTDEQLSIIRLRTTKQ